MKKKIFIEFVKYDEILGIIPKKHRYINVNAMPEILDYIEKYKLDDYELLSVVFEDDFWNLEYGDIIDRLNKCYSLLYEVEKINKYNYMIECIKKILESTIQSLNESLYY